MSARVVKHWAEIEPLIDQLFDIPVGERAEWLRQTDPLVVRIPDPDHGVAAAHQAELRDLLARAVGFQITFDSEGSS